MRCNGECIPSTFNCIAYIFLWANPGVFFFILLFSVVSKLLWLWLDSIVGPLMSDVRSVHLVYIDQLSRCLYTEAKESVCSWSTITQIFFLGFDLSFNYSPASLDNFRTLQVGSGMVKSQSLTTFPQQTSLTAGKLTLFTKSFSIN